MLYLVHGGGLELVAWPIGESPREKLEAKHPNRIHVGSAAVAAVDDFRGQVDGSASPGGQGRFFVRVPEALADHTARQQRKLMHWATPIIAAHYSRPPRQRLQRTGSSAQSPLP